MESSRNKNMRRGLKTLLCLLLIVPCVGLLVACGAGGGFGSQTDLAKAHFDAFKVPTSYAGAKTPTIQNSLRFYYGTGEMANAPVVQTLERMKSVSEKQARAEHDAKIKGEWVTEYNADGSAKTKLTGTALDEYKKAYDDAKKTAESYKYVSSKKLEAETTGAATAADEGLATNIEVWEVTYEYTPWENGTAGTKKTDQKYTIPMQKIDGKWYLTEDINILSIILGSIGLGGMPA